MSPSPSYDEEESCFSGEQCPDSHCGGHPHRQTQFPGFVLMLGALRDSLRNPRKCTSKLLGGVIPDHQDKDRVIQQTQTWSTTLSESLVTTRKLA